jgi:hypothetical protein
MALLHDALLQQASTDRWYGQTGSTLSPQL